MMSLLKRILKWLCLFYIFVIAFYTWVYSTVSYYDHHSLQESSRINWRNLNWKNPCSKSPLEHTPTCDKTKSFEERAYDLIYHQQAKLDGNGIDIYERLSSNNAESIPEINIAEYEWWSEALHGVAHNYSRGVWFGDDIKYSTMFPQVITIASTFNSSLFHMIGQVISTEARAMNNYHHSGLTFWAPNINIFRDPRWGRGQETPGECPFLTSIYAVEFVTGMEGNHEKYLKTSACCKHFADYSQEEGRKSLNVIVSNYDQNNTYLVAFKYCVMTANVSGIMCSYNAVNGIPSCGNKELMTTLLRDTWGFYGYITSDCGAVEFIENEHHYTNTTADTINKVYDAGMDMECGHKYIQTNLQSAVKNGSVSIEKVQKAMYRAALVQFRLGMFDDITSTPWSNLGPKDMCTDYNLNLSLDASRQGIVLLKNINNALPLQLKSSSIALIGPNANSKQVMKGNYFGEAPFILSVMDGLLEYVDPSNIDYQYGVDINSPNTSGIKSAVNASQKADITILVMGLQQSEESESMDRSSIDLPGQQNNLIQQVSTSSKGVVILVILSGGCIDISEWRDSDNIKGIIWAGYPGMFGGRAIADIIFGTFNPTGKLSQTWYYKNYTQQIEMMDMNMRPNIIRKSPGRGYRYFNGNVVYSFGAGMSYTTFTCTQPQEITKQIVLTVKNIGNIAGGAVILVYFFPTNGGQNGVEIKQLIAFGRANLLNSGDSQQLTMNIYPEFLNGEQHKNMNGKYIVSCMHDIQ